MGKKQEQKQIEQDKRLTIRWKGAPDEHDYLAALSYLSLLLSRRQAERVVDALHREEPCTYEASDLLRAAHLPLLPRDDPHVAHDLEKVRKGKELVPILLVGGDLLKNAPLVIADGYHRVCAAYHINEDLEIPCRIVEWPPTTAPANE
jgi:hypothetical protein